MSTGGLEAIRNIPGNDRYVVFYRATGIALVMKLEHTHRRLILRLCTNGGRGR